MKSIFHMQGLKTLFYTPFHRKKYSFVPISYIKHHLKDKFHTIDHILITLCSLILWSKFILKPFLSKQNRIQITMS